MLSVIVATHESERTLVPTLSALVPGAMSGLVTEVVVADAGSGDATAEVADIAGCRFMIAEGDLGARLRDAARSTRTPWLMFMRAGLVPEPGWMAAAESFMQAAAFGENSPRAAIFRAFPGLSRKRRPQPPPFSAGLARGRSRLWLLAPSCGKMCPTQGTNAYCPALCRW